MGCSIWVFFVRSECIGRLRVLQEGYGAKNLASTWILVVYKSFQDWTIGVKIWIKFHHQKTQQSEVLEGYSYRG